MRGQRFARNTNVHEIRGSPFAATIAALFVQAAQRSFSCPAGTAGFRVQLEREKPRRGYGVDLAAGGELVHQTAAMASQQAVADGFSPQLAFVVARSANPLLDIA